MTVSFNSFESGQQFTRTLLVHHCPSLGGLCVCLEYTARQVLKVLHFNGRLMKIKFLSNSQKTLNFGVSWRYKPPKRRPPTGSSCHWITVSVILNNPEHDYSYSV